MDIDLISTTTGKGMGGDLPLKDTTTVTGHVEVRLSREGTGREEGGRSVSRVWTGQSHGFDSKSSLIR